MNIDGATAAPQAKYPTPEPRITYPVEIPMGIFRHLERFAAARQETVQEFITSTIESDVQACLENELLDDQNAIERLTGMLRRAAR